MPLTPLSFTTTTTNMKLEERTTKSYAKIAEMNDTLKKNKPLFKHTVVQQNVAEEEYEEWVKTLRELTRGVSEVEKKKQLSTTPEDIFELTQLRSADLQHAKIKRKHEQLTKVIADAKDWVVNDRMQQKESEYKGWHDSNHRYYWQYRLNGTKYALRESYEGKLYVMGKIYLHDGDWDIELNWDIPILHSEFAPTPQLAPPLTPKVLTPKAKPLAPYSKLRDPKESMFNHPYIEDNVKCTYVHKDGEWKNLRNAQKKKLASAKTYTCHMHDIEDSYDHMVVRFVTDAEAHYYKMKEGNGGKRLYVQMAKDAKPFELNKKSKTQFDVLLK